ncbi:MAG: ABC transporter ATP-binding protein [Treponema sp.]|nr:ABC transporter ATP-binding protein [Treponema sp.]
MSQTVTITNVTKIYGGKVRAVDNVSLTINKGEFFTLLGPSGCGKTTLLRMIAGFISIEAGTISFDDKVINNIPPHQRNTGMVFQNYAIFPHMTVFDNVAYGLKARRIPKPEINRRVSEILELIRIEEYKDRQPNQLSGGQQQRVALARSIVINPDILLMDEPLSNLDAKLRIEMRAAIKDIQKRLNITTIYVTHDQEEALAISDRIAVMNLGQLQQLGHPFDIYSRPENSFVSGFIGTTNFIPGETSAGTDNTLKVRVLDSAEISIPVKKQKPGKVLVAVRPEEAFLGKPDGGISGEIMQVTFLGDTMNYIVKLKNDQLIEVNEYIKDSPNLRNSGDIVSVNLNIQKINLFTEDGSESLI